MALGAKVDLTPKNNLYLPLKTFGRRGQFYFGLSAFVGFDFTYALSCEFDVVCRMHDTVQDCISHGRFTDCLVPVSHGQLRCDDDGFPPVPVFDDFRQVGTFFGIKRDKENVVED